MTEYISRKGEINHVDITINYFQVDAKFIQTAWDQVAEIAKQETQAANLEVFTSDLDISV